MQNVRPAVNSSLGVCLPTAPAALATGWSRIHTKLIICVYPGNRLNQDSNYKQSICEVVDFKHVLLSKLVREQSALDEDYLQDPLTTALHVAASEGLTKTVFALLSSFGADAVAKDKVLGIMLSLSCARVLSLSSYWLTQYTHGA
jgi:hypothetical protein